MKSPRACGPGFRLLTFAVLAALGAAQGQAPNSVRYPELHGQVEHVDGTPFREGALVKIDNDLGGMAAQVVTDSRGRFDVELSERSRYTITVHAMGFRDASTEVDLKTVPRAYIQLTLHDSSSPTPAAISSAAAPATISISDLDVPEAAQIEFEKGRSLLLEKNKPADSVKSFLKAIQIAPTYSQAHFLLGTAYMDARKWSEAEAELSKAVTYNDKLGPADLALGSCLIEEKKFADAEKPLLRGLELVPDDARGRYDLGRAYYTLSRFAEAEESGRKAIAVAPDFAEAHLLLGNVLLRLRDGAHAMAEFQEYLRLAPNGAFAGPAQELVKKLQAALPASH